MEMKGRLRTRRKLRVALGAASIGLGLALAFSAWVVGTAATEVGRPDAIEAALTTTGRPPAPTRAPESPASPAYTTVEDDDAPRPLWSANVLSRSPTTTPVPVAVSIEAISVTAPIVAQGVNPDNGEMEVPDTVTEVAWYEHGPSPGEPGSAVLAAHVDLRNQGRGVFFHLDRLAQGDLVTVTYDNGATQRFQVEARVTYPKEELPLATVFSREGPAVLTLITCGGGFNSSVGSYDSNVVVYAVPVDRPTLPVAS